MTLQELKDIREGLYHTQSRKCRISLKNNYSGLENTFTVSPYRVRLKLAQMERLDTDKLSQISCQVDLID